MTISSISRHRRARRVPGPALAVLLAIALTLAVTSLALAHAVVYPKTSKAGGYEKYVLRVPNEKATPTLRVEIRFPASLRVTSFGDVPGWQIEVLTDSAKRIVGAVWTGSLPPQRFVEFPFVGANPKTPTSLVWPVYQTYADGPRVEWTGAEGSKSPASVTSIVEAGTDAPGSGGGPRWVPWAALVLALISLGHALRKPDGSRVQSR
jgi:uncharacterized protein YcnI